MRYLHYLAHGAGTPDGTLKLAQSPRFTRHMTAVQHLCHQFVTLCCQLAGAIRDQGLDDMQYLARNGGAIRYYTQS